jgi:hypothetical protein
MQLFSRRVHMVGATPAEMMTYATDMRSYVTGKVGRDVALWATTFGAPVGTMSYTVRVEGVADLQATMSVLMGDEEYQAKLAKGAHMSGGPAVDSLMQPIYGELGATPPVGSMAAVTTAEIANGAVTDAIAWGVDMAMHVESVTGMTCLFLASQYGPFGTVGWISGAADAAGVDAANAAINADEAYMGKLGAIGDLFREGSGHQALLTRIA